LLKMMTQRCGVSRPEPRPAPSYLLLASSMVFLYVATFVVGFAAIALWVILNPGKEEKLKGEDSVAEDDDIPLNEEPWIPTMEVKDWTEAASFESCPWNFGHCESVEDVLNCIWKTPVPKDLHVGFDAMQKSVKGVSIAYVKLGSLKEIHYCILYTLRSGAELFGGAPSEQTVGLELEPGEETAGLRRRRGAEASANSWRIVNDENPLPCIAAFFRIHDGFGTLMSRKHLPLLLESPVDTIHGSCFYVYPKRGLQPMGQRPTLLRMARVDKTCCVAVDRRKAEPGVVYVERNSQFTEDEETPLSFIADTVSNISGNRVVPPPYEGGPSVVAQS